MREEGGTGAAGGERGKEIFEIGEGVNAGIVEDVVDFVFGEGWGGHVEEVVHERAEGWEEVDLGM